MGSALCCTTGIHHFVAELRLGISTVFCACWTSDAASQQARLPLTSGTALVESPLSSELSGRSVPGVASQNATSTIQSVIRFEMTCSCGANFITAMVSSRIDSGTSTSTICSTIQSRTRSWHRNVDVALHDALLDPLLWNGSEGPPGNKRELRLRTTVFADAVNVAQRTTRLPCLQRIPKRKSLGLSLSKRVCFLLSVLNWAERSFLSISISLCFVMESSCCFATGTSTVVSM